MKKQAFIFCATVALMPAIANATNSHSERHTPVSDKMIAEQRSELAQNTLDKSFGPQAPRDIDTIKGNNKHIFGSAPAYSSMNLCNIHFHKNAEHKGGEFAKYAGNGDGHGYNSGYIYTGKLTDAELSPLKEDIGESEHGSLYPGDTIEVHYVYSTAQVKPGSTLGACLNDSTNNPQLRVEAQVFVLVNDDKALNFVTLTEHGIKAGYQQAFHLLENTGPVIQYAGSTTGPGYNEKASPFQVTWGVRTKVAKVSIKSVGKWLEHNDFNENHAHGVRNLVINPALLSNQ